METNYNKKWIFWFNKNKTKELYENVINDKFKEATRCIHCHKPIYYYDSTFRINQYDQLILKNKSYLSTKELLGETYHLCVCEDCLTKKFPEYQNLNKSRVFNRICDITNYAYGISDKVSENWKQDNYSITEENLIKKHGEVEGKNIWKCYCDKQALSNTFGYKQEKHGEVEGRLIFNNFRECCKFKKYSNISQNIFNELKQYLNYTLYYATNNHEYVFEDFLNDKKYYVDCYIKELDLVIEFNGDKWHANPEIYNADDMTIKLKDKNNELIGDFTAKYIWEKDKKRISFLKTKVKHLIIIWEKDFNKKGLNVAVNELLDEIKLIESEK